MSTPILATKLYIPRPRPNVVSRPRLIERLNEGLHDKLTLISAPAGFGKTNPGQPMAGRVQAISYDIQQVFYAYYLLAAGYLVFRSTFLPRTVGVLLAIGGLCYLTYSFATFLSPGFAAHLVPYIQLPFGVGELSLCLWLLVMVVNVSRWEKQASRASEPDQSDPGRAAV